MYDPTLGRWIQQDPMGYVDGPNNYQYLVSAPTNSLDPLGTIVIFILGANPLSETDHKEHAGLTKLRTVLQQSGPQNLGEYIVLTNKNSDRAITMIKQAKAKNPGEPVILVGHSWGGDDILEIADALKEKKINSGRGPVVTQPGIKIDLLIAIDPVGCGDKAVNADRALHLRPANLDDYFNVLLWGAQYTWVEGTKRFKFKNVTHTTIDDDPRVHKMITEELQNISSRISGPTTAPAP